MSIIKPSSTFNANNLLLTVMCRDKFPTEKIIGHARHCSIQHRASMKNHNGMCMYYSRSAIIK